MVGDAPTTRGHPRRDVGIGVELAERPCAHLPTRRCSTDASADCWTRWTRAANCGCVFSRTMPSRGNAGEVLFVIIEARSRAVSAEHRAAAAGQHADRRVARGRVGVSEPTAAAAQPGKAFIRRRCGPVSAARRLRPGPRCLDLASFTVDEARITVGWSRSSRLSSSDVASFAQPVSGCDGGGFAGRTGRDRHPPGLSQLLGNTPLGPIGWVQGLGSAIAATLAAAAIRLLGQRLAYAASDEAAGGVFISTIRRAKVRVQFPQRDGQHPRHDDGHGSKTSRSTTSTRFPCGRDLAANRRIRHDEKGNNDRKVASNVSHRTAVEPVATPQPLPSPFLLSAGFGFREPSISPITARWPVWAYSRSSTGHCAGHRAVMRWPTTTTTRSPRLGEALEDA